MDPVTGLVAAQVGAEVLKNLYTLFKQAKTVAQPQSDEANRRANLILVEPTIGSYVTRNEEFKNYINDLCDLIQVYIEKKKSDRPLNVLLAAPPGSGKSFLIKQLIKSLENVDDNSIVFEEIYIGSLDNIDEIRGIFQRIQSLNPERKLPFVFFDEIDSEIRGEYVYAKFLAPMWDGNFYVGKEKFCLGRCVFFFAGSSLSAEKVSNEILKVPAQQKIAYSKYFDEWFEGFKTAINSDDERLKKTPDFGDRIDYVLRIPPLHKALLGEELLLMEQIDLACVLIKEHFPKVKFIDPQGLFAIVRLLATTASRRPAEKAVFGARLSKENTFEFNCLSRRIQAEFWTFVSEQKGPIYNFEKSSDAMAVAYYQIEIKSPPASGKRPVS